jgi:hypothetical protein
MKLLPFTLPITTTATPYSSGDVVGVGSTGLAIPGGITPGNGVLKNLCVVDTTNQGAALTLLFFKSVPTGPYTDNAAFAWGTGDKVLVNAPILIPASAYTTVAGVAMANGEYSTGLRWTVPTDGSIAYLNVVIVTTGTPTYGANATSLRLEGSIVYAF